MFSRPTSLAAAFVAATAAEIQRGKVDHHRGHGHWVARRIALAAEAGSHLGIVREYDKRPNQHPVQTGVRVTKQLDPATINAINDGIMNTMSTLVAGRKVELMDEESLGLD